MNRMLGFRGRLFAMSMALMATFALAMGAWLELSLRPLLETQEIDELRFATATVEVALQQADPAASAGSIELQSTVQSIAEQGSMRITLIDPDGVVRADSEVRAEAVSEMAWHGDRAELIEAHRTGEWGSARRLSSTLQEEMLYVARVVPWEDGRMGTLRIARRTIRTDAAIRALYRLLAVALVGGLAVALLMTAMAASLMHTDLGLLLRHTAALARGDQTEPLQFQSSVELAGIVGKVNQMSHEMQRVVGTLARERRRSSAVLSALHEGLLSVDPDGKLSLVNPAGTALTGLSLPDIGRPLASAIDNPELAALIDVAREDGESMGDVIFSGSDDGSARIVQVRVRMGTSGESVVSMHDVSHLRSLETMRRDFVANVSHELRTPVSIVQASAEALQDGAIDDPRYAAQFLDAILRNTERLRLLTTDILQLSRIEAGHTGIALEAVDIGDVVDDVIEILQLRAANQGHSISSTVPEGVDVLADAGALEQILVNLLENALKYTPEGERIEVGAGRRATDRVRIYVADTGSGIPEQHRHRIFERFYRVDSGRSREVGGTGLGLAIVKHLAEAMHGSVGVEANEPSGAVFWLELPEAPTALRPDDG